MLYVFILKIKKKKKICLHLHLFIKYKNSFAYAYASFFLIANIFFQLLVCLHLSVFVTFECFALFALFLIFIKFNFNSHRYCLQLSHFLTLILSFCFLFFSSFSPSLYTLFAGSFAVVVVIMTIQSFAIPTRHHALVAEAVAEETIQRVI